MLVVDVSVKVRKFHEMAGPKHMPERVTLSINLIDMESTFIDPYLDEVGVVDETQSREYCILYEYTYGPALKLVGLL